MPLLSRLPGPPAGSQGWDRRPVFQPRAPGLRGAGVSRAGRRRARDAGRAAAARLLPHGGPGVLPGGEPREHPRGVARAPDAPAGPLPRDNAR
jgi:hypothetical protein